ncbi:hypothetical protein BDR26DRAFT_914335 [Obelidium mucronatum]|nr:hypothetical protein BDR26DRAFT_914335 [Obelidium mucronatum]
MPIQRFEVVGRGHNLRPSDLGITVDAGWDTEAELEGSVLLKVGAPIRHVRVQAELRGYMETRWEPLNRLAKRPEAADYPIVRHGRVFLQQVQVVYDNAEAIAPSPIGGSLSFPFKFVLPKNNMPPSFRTAAGSIQYYIKCSLLFQEPMKLLLSSKELEVPVSVRVPDSAKKRLLESPSHITHHSPASNEKIGYVLQLPKRVLTMGESVEADISIFSTPKHSTLSSISATLHSIAHYVNQDNRGAQAKSPRPLSEVNHVFPKQTIVTASDPVVHRLQLLVDPSLALASFESPLISVKTFLRLTISLDNSNAPNIQHEIPIVVVSPFSTNLQTGSPFNTPIRPKLAEMAPLSPMPQLLTPTRSSESTTSTDHSTEFSTLPDARLPIPPITLPKRNVSLKVQSPPLGHHSNNHSNNNSNYSEQFSYLLSQLDEVGISYQRSDHSKVEFVEEHTSMISSDSGPSNDWSIEMVAEWLGLLGVPATVVEIFIAQEIDGAILKDLSDEDLRDELGVASESLRERILNAKRKACK